MGGAQKARRVMACFAALGFVATRAANFLFMNCTHKHHRRSPFSTRAADTRAKSAADRRLSHAGALFCVRAKSGNAEYYLMYQASAFALRVYAKQHGRTAHWAEANFGTAREVYGRHRRRE